MPATPVLPELGPWALVGRDHPALHEPAKLIDEVTAHHWNLAARLVATVRAHDGVALTAPQIGHGVSLMASIGGDVVANPRITEASTDTELGRETCLSLPGRVYEVERPSKVQVTGMGLDGQWSQWWVDGFLARMWCHTIDHLNGIMLSDI